MGIVGALRRFSRIPIPGSTVLPDEELRWPPAGVRAISVDALQTPKTSEDLILTEPGIQRVRLLGPPTIPALPDASDWAKSQVYDLLDAFALPALHGSIYLKTEDDAVQQGKPVRTTRVVAPTTKQAPTRNEPRGLGIFEMLLPILLPPAVTEFHEELLFPHELYPFQRAGVKWLFENESALLADDMGLGKTVQSITAFRALIRTSKALQALVICPKSVLANWMRELRRWAPELVAIQIHGTQTSRQNAWRAYMGKCHVIVATYETVRQDRDSIRGRVFDVIVADEVQKIKNPQSFTSQAVRGLSVRRRWALTGTPIENSVEDMTAIFGFVKPGLFQGREARSLSARQVRERVRPYLLRRRKEEALPELPEMSVNTKWLELTESQRRTYDRTEREGVSRLRGNRDVTVQHVLALITELKQICNFDPVTRESAKVEYLTEEFLEEACQDNTKALVISQYVASLRELESHLAAYKPLTYTGQLSTGQRSSVEEAFSSKDEHRILLLSLKAGGVGLNLTRANYVLHFDRWWNPAVENQAQARAHRIGQSRAVFVTRLICQDTIEERIEQLLERKKILFAEVVDELADVTLERVLSEEALFGLFGLTPPKRSRTEGELVAPASAATAQPRSAVVISPSQPFSNLMSLRRILREGEAFIWWADLHFHARALEELVETVDPALIQEIRILSGPANADDRAKRDFARFRDELQRKSVQAEWRVLQGFAHDRFIISRQKCYNVPPVNSLLQGSYAEILETPHRPPFEEWWNIGTPL